jgi:hypothetical protein
MDFLFDTVEVFLVWQENPVNSFGVFFRSVQEEIIWFSFSMDATALLSGTEVG